MPAGPFHRALLTGSPSVLRCPLTTTDPFARPAPGYTGQRFRSGFDEEELLLSSPPAAASDGEVVTPQVIPDVDKLHKKTNHHYFDLMSLFCVLLSRYLSLLCCSIAVCCFGKIRQCVASPRLRKEAHTHTHTLPAQTQTTRS